MWVLLLYRLEYRGTWIEQLRAFDVKDRIYFATKKKKMVKLEGSDTINFYRIITSRNFFSLKINFIFIWWFFLCKDIKWFWKCSTRIFHRSQLSPNWLAANITFEFANSFSRKDLWLRHIVSAQQRSVAFLRVTLLMLSYKIMMTYYKFFISLFLVYIHLFVRYIQLIINIGTRSNKSYHMTHMIWVNKPGYI